MIKMTSVEARRRRAVADLEAWNERARKNASPAASELTDEDVVRLVHDRFDVLSQRIAAAYAEVPMKDGLAEIDAAVERERRR
jgi:hypothetical protein